jgi:hypothetical protein
MAEKNKEDESQELVYGPEMHTFTYPPPVPCGECGGTGKIALLVSTRACGPCQGMGQVWPEPLHEHVPPQLGRFRRERAFDEQGRLIRESVWFVPVGDSPGNADA